MMLIEKFNIRKFFYTAVAMLIIISAHSYTFGNCMKCSEVNLSENSDCCCNVKDTPQNKCCSTEENPSEHACYQCNNNIAFVPEEKIVLPKQNEFKHFNIFETFQVSSDELIKPFNTLFVEKYPKLSYSLLTYIVVLRI